MSTHDDLHAQIAQRLFGWMPAWDPYDPRRVTWEDPTGLRHDAPPAYTTDPMATALVLAWVERQCSKKRFSIEFIYEKIGVFCGINKFGGLYIGDQGATLSEALCRAALALAEALGEGETHA